MYVTPILLLLLASNAFADGAKDWQERFSNVGINTKETSCVVKDLKMNLDTLLSMANEQQNEINPAASNENDTPKLIPITDGCLKKYYVSDGPLVFEAALSYCRGEGFQLATPDTSIKFQCLRGTLKNGGYPKSYWIAASNVNSKFFFWKTTHEIAELYSHWDTAKGYPTGLSDRCVIINGGTSFIEEAVCTNLRHFICETK